MLKAIEKNKGVILVILALVLMFFYYTSSIKQLSEIESNQQITYYEK